MAAVLSDPAVRQRFEMLPEFGANELQHPAGDSLSRARWAAAEPTAIEPQGVMSEEREEEQHIATIQHYLEEMNVAALELNEAQEAVTSVAKERQRLIQLW